MPKRISLTDKPQIYSERTLTEILPDTLVPFHDNGSGRVVSIPVDFTFEEGGKYHVVFDREEYDLVYSAGLVLSDESSLIFKLLVSNGDLEIYSDLSGSHTIQLYSVDEIVHKLPDKYVGIDSADVARIVKDEFVSGYPTTHFRIDTSIYAYRTYTPNADGLYDWKNWEDEWTNCYASTLHLSASNYDKQLSVRGLKGWNIRNNSNLPYGYVGIAADSLMAQHYVQANAFIFDPDESTDYFTLAVDKDGNITLVKTRVSNDYKLNTVQIPTSENMILKSSTEGSEKQFKITVDDSGTITATEVTE